MDISKTLLMISCKSVPKTWISLVLSVVQNIKGHLKYLFSVFLEIINELAIQRQQKSEHTRRTMLCMDFLNLLIWSSNLVTVQENDTIRLQAVQTTVHRSILKWNRRL